MTGKRREQDKKWKWEWEREREGNAEAEAEVIREESTLHAANAMPGGEGSLSLGTERGLTSWAEILMGFSHVRPHTKAQ